MVNPALITRCCSEVNFSNKFFLLLLLVCCWVFRKIGSFKNRIGFGILDSVLLVPLNQLVRLQTEGACCSLCASKIIRCNNVAGSFCFRSNDPSIANKVDYSEFFDNCAYYDLNSLNSLATNQEFFMMHLNVRSIQKNVDKLATL